MKCRNCKHNGFLADEDGVQYSWCRVVSDNLDPEEERKCRHYAPATHAEQLRAMTDEELADFLDKTDPVFWKREIWLDWLKQEVHE